MTKNIFSTILLAALIALTGCKSNDTDKSGDPRAVLQAFIEKLSKKDIDGAAALATAESKGTFDIMKMGMDMAEKMNLDSSADEDEDLKDAEFGEAKIDGNLARVPFKNSRKNVSFDFQLKKEQGEWKVDFSLSTLMKLGMEAAAQQGEQENGLRWDMDSNESREAMEQYMHPDSIQKGMKQIDSMLRNMDPEQMEQLKKIMQEAQKLKS